VKLEGSRLCFQSKFAGVVYVDLAHVQSLATDRPVPVHLPDGRVELRRLVRDGSGRYVPEALPPTDQQRMTPEIPQEPQQTTTAAPPADKKAKWSGYVSAGGFVSRGNYHADIANVSLGLTRKDDPHRTNIVGNYYYARKRTPSPATRSKRRTTAC